MQLFKVIMLVCLVAVIGGLPAYPVGADEAQSAEKKEEIMTHGSWNPGLSDAEQAVLLSIARDTLNWCVSAPRGAAFDFSSYEITPRLREICATFVTLKIAGSLRGCIGSLEPVAPLFQSVHDNAVNAAMRDPRFPPLSKSELKAVHIDISVLSPIEPIGEPDDFLLGEHGIILEKGRYRSVFLPEVAEEQGWSREDTFMQLCLKAGLPPDAWRQDCRFKVFSSFLIAE